MTASVETSRNLDLQGQIGGKPLDGHHALVTGASRGIGAAIADTLGRLGADLTLTGRTPDLLEKQAQNVAGKHGVTTVVQVGDVRDYEEMTALFNKAASDNRPVSILINNAGSGKSAPFQRLEPSLWEEMLSVNLTGVYVCCRAAIPGMLSAGYGRIINVSSTAGLKGYPYVAAYCAAKHGVIGLTRSLALEMATKGITVNAICPGYTETDMVREAIDNIVAKTGRSPKETTDELAANNPQKRLIQPWEVAETAAWLALPSSASITGQAIAVAGGEVH